MRRQLGGIGAVVLGTSSALIGTGWIHERKKGPGPFVERHLARRPWEPHDEAALQREGSQDQGEESVEEFSRLLANAKIFTRRVVDRDVTVQRVAGTLFSFASSALPQARLEEPQAKSTRAAQTEVELPAIEPQTEGNSITHDSSKNGSSSLDTLSAQIAPGIVLFGPRGAGREHAIRSMLSIFKGTVFYVDSSLFEKSWKELSFASLFQGFRFETLPYDVYCWAALRTGVFSLKEIICDTIRDSSLNPGLWIIDEIESDSDRHESYSEVITVVLEASNSPVILNVDVDQAELWLAKARPAEPISVADTGNVKQSLARPIGALYLGDPIEEEDKRMRLDAILQALCEREGRARYHIDEMSELRKVLEDRIGWRLQDSCELVDALDKTVKGHTVVPSDEQECSNRYAVEINKLDQHHSFDDPNLQGIPSIKELNKTDEAVKKTSFAGAADLLISRDKEAMTRFFLLAPDEEMVVWTWETLETLCDPSVVVGGIEDAEHLVTGVRATALRNFERIPLSLEMALDEARDVDAHTHLQMFLNLCGMTEQILEFVFVNEGKPPPLVAVRKRIDSAYQELADELAFKQKLWARIDRVREMQRIHRLGMDMLYFEQRKQVYENANGALTELINKIERDRAKGKKTGKESLDALFKARVDLDSEKRSLSYVLEDLLYRYREIYKSGECVNQKTC